MPRRTDIHRIMIIGVPRDGETHSSLRAVSCPHPPEEQVACGCPTVDAAVPRCATTGRVPQPSIMTVGAAAGFSPATWSLLSMGHPSEDSLRQCLVSIGAAEIGVLAISFSFALFTVQSVSQGSSYRTVSVYLADKAFSRPFAAVATIAIGTLLLSLAPSEPRYLSFASGLAFAGLGATCFLVWHQFSNTAAHADPITAIVRWHERGIAALRRARDQQLSPEALIATLSVPLLELQRRTVSGATVFQTIALEIQVALEELTMIAERIGTGANVGRFSDAVERIADLLLHICTALRDGLRVEMHPGWGFSSNMNPLLSRYLDRLSRLCEQRLREGDIARANVVIDGLGGLVRRLQDLLYGS